VGGETKLSADGIKGPEHSSKVMRLEGTGTCVGFRHGPLPQTAGGTATVSLSQRHPVVLIRGGNICRIYCKSMTVGGSASGPNVPSVGPRMAYTRCGIVGVDARPNWKE
jgi:hypothetical protein